MPLHKLSNNELRDYCRAAIESLEYWLRRLIDETLSQEFGSNYLKATNDNGDNILGREIRESITNRYQSNQERYSRLIDAAMLDDAIDIVCHPKLFSKYFKEPLSDAFPEGREEARTFLLRLTEPRNHLSHANPISIRQAEQVICYTHDVIDFLKSYYNRKNMGKEYNAPSIIRITDSFGLDKHSGQFKSRGAIHRFDDEKALLRPGDKLSIEVEIDPSYDTSEYTIKWDYSNQSAENRPINGPKCTIEFNTSHVTSNFVVTCTVTSNKEWHRFGRLDDQVRIHYKVLPPL